MPAPDWLTLAYAYSSVSMSRKHWEALRWDSVYLHGWKGRVPLPQSYKCRATSVGLLEAPRAVLPHNQPTAIRFHFEFEVQLAA